MDNPELEESLESRLRELNKTRNNLEHYAIDVDIDKIEKLISKIKIPLIKFLEKKLNNFKQEDVKAIKMNWQNVDKKIWEVEQIENEVYTLIQKINGQSVPGELLGTEGILQLPNFTEVLKNPLFEFKERIMELDVVATDESSKKWIIEIKAKSRNLRVVDQILNSIKIVKGTPWVIVFDSVNLKLKAYAKENGVFITGYNEWEELKKLIEK